MYIRAIGYFKVCSGVQVYKIKIWLWSQHSDPETHYSKQRRETLMLKKRSADKAVIWRWSTKSQSSNQMCIKLCSQAL